MTPQTELEINGTFFAHPFAELVTEITQARLNGSLRGSQKEKKWVIYFKKGKVVFAVSNARNAKLFDILLRRNRLTKKHFAGAPNFSNDFELAAFLEEKKLLSKTECDQLFAEQIQAIIIDILSWTEGDWSFSSLTRIRDGLAFDINAKQLLIDYARCLPIDTVLGRFRSLEETFMRSDAEATDLNLGADEAFVLSRAEETPLTATDLVSLAAMTESRALHAIYTLWTGGLLLRKEWRPAFSEHHIAAMKGARLELKQEAKMHHFTKSAAETPVAESKPKAAVPQEPEVTITVEDYLAQVENAETYYDILGVDSDALIDELKRAYFKLARSFHPDKFHAEGGEKLKRIQSAFTELAQAHETLKNEASREMYDYRMRKEIAEREKHRAAGTQGNVQLEQAAEHFERGFGLLIDGDVERALPFLARAVHFDPKPARYHAYYGKALSADEKQRHKAESEMQAAIRIDQNNPTFRILLAEFFIQNNLMKRAEGELNRLLATFPSNREARDLLNSLKS
ncbi:MAG: DnaJ domain-containing protein [Pyrinomonadaceae bacterium]